MATDAASGLAYLERVGYVHKDVAARNCIVTQDLSVKITGKQYNGGFSSLLSANTSTSSQLLHIQLVMFNWVQAHFQYLIIGSPKKQ